MSADCSSGVISVLTFDGPQRPDDISVTEVQVYSYYPSCCLDAIHCRLVCVEAFCRNGTAQLTTGHSSKEQVFVRVQKSQLTRDKRSMAYEFFEPITIKFCPP